MKLETVPISCALPNEHPGVEINLCAEFHGDPEKSWGFIESVCAVFHILLVQVIMYLQEQE